MIEWMNEWMIEMNEWMSEWMIELNEWMNKWFETKTTNFINTFALILMRQTLKRYTGPGSLFNLQTFWE